MGHTIELDKLGQTIGLSEQKHDRLERAAGHTME